MKLSTPYECKLNFDMNINSGLKKITTVTKELLVYICHNIINHNS